MNGSLQIQIENNSINEKLLFGFNEKGIRLSSIFICFRCFGILIDPWICNSCKMSICDSCFKYYKDKPQFFCFCIKSEIENFVASSIPNIDKTSYFLKNQKGFLDPSEHKYLVAIQKLNANTLDIIPILLGNKYSLVLEKVIQTINFIKIYVAKHCSQFNHKSIKKYFTIMNFINRKGLKINFVNKILCKKEAKFLANFKLKEIRITGCFYEINFVIEFAKSIVLNRKTLKSFVIANNPNIDLRAEIIIYKALSFCRELANLSIIQKRNDTSFSSFRPSNFFEFFSSFHTLQNLFFKSEIFLNFQDLKSIELLISLESIQIIDCSFEVQSFFHLLKKYLKGII